MKKNENIRLMTFQEKRATARKKRTRQISAAVALGITAMGLAIGAIRVFGKSNNVAAEKPVPAMEVKETDPSFKTLDSVLNGTNEEKKKAEVRAKLEAEQEAKTKAENEAKEAQKKAEEEQVAAVNKLIEEEVAKVEKAAQEEITKVSSQVDSLTKSNQTLMAENDALKQEIARLKSQTTQNNPQNNQGSTQTSNSDDLGRVDLPQ